MAFTDLHEIEEMFAQLEGQTVGATKNGGFYTCFDPNWAVPPSRQPAAHAKYQRDWRKANPERAKAADIRQRKRDRARPEVRARKAATQRAYAARQLAKRACLPSGT